MNLAEAAAEGIMLHDGERVIDVNPKFARLFGYDRKEVLGRPLLEFVAPESHAAVIEHIQSGSTDTRVSCWKCRVHDLLAEQLPPGIRCQILVEFLNVECEISRTVSPGRRCLLGSPQP